MSISAFPGQFRRRQAGIVVCESGNQWAVAIRRILGREVSLFETRTLPDCKAQIAIWPLAVVSIQATPRIADHLPTWIWNQKRTWPHCRIILLGVNSQQPDYWAAIEAGADGVAENARDFARCAPWVVRQIAEAPSPTYRTVQEEVAAGLPWSGLDDTQTMPPADRFKTVRHDQQNGE